MKLKPQIYNLLTKEPMETQQINDSKIEIYKMNDYPELMEQLGKQSYNLSIMTFLDTNNYKIVIEEGYFNVMKPFYQEGSNKEWITYWKTMEKMVMYNKRLTIGIFSLIGLSFVLMILLADSSFINSLMFALLFFNFLAVIISKRIFTSRAKKQHSMTVENIKKYIGVEVFEELLEKHQNYMDKYFGINKEVSEEINEDVVTDDKSEDNN